MKSTAMSGVKEFLKPDAYKQSELQVSVVRSQEPGAILVRLTPDPWHLGDGVPFV